MPDTTWLLKNAIETGESDMEQFRCERNDSPDITRCTRWEVAQFGCSVTTHISTRLRCPKGLTYVLGY